MKEWFSASELTNKKAMPTTERGCKKRAEKENWRNRPRSGRGGGLEYHISSLPLETQRELLIQQSPLTPEQLSNEPVAKAIAPTGQELQPHQPKTAAELAGWQRRIMLARHGVLREVDRLAAQLGREQAVRIICEMAQQHNLSPKLTQLLPIANAKSRSGQGKQTLTRRTVYRWLDARAQGEVHLAPKNRKPAPLPAWAGPLLQLYQRPQKPSIAWCIRELEKMNFIPLPSLSAARRLLKKMSKIEREAGRMGPRELKNIKPFTRRDTRENWPCDVYIADGHTFDAEIAHPKHGKPFRPEITSIIDAATRRLVGWSVDLAESGLAVLDALRLSCCTGGIPLIFYTDNGSGYVNAMMTAEGHGMLDRLGITHQTSLPYNSQARGQIERLHRTVWVTAAKMLPTYIGADMDKEASHKAHKLTRKQIKASGKSDILMSWQAFVRFADEQVTDYNSRPHKSLPMLTDDSGKRRHETPLEAWARAEREGWEMTAVEPEFIVDLFRPQIARKTLRGEVSIFGNTYFSHDLAEHHGETVRVGYDIHDAERVWVRDRNDHLICVAEFEANKRAYFPVTALEEAAHKRAQARLGRAERKIDEIEQEQRGARPVIEHQPLSPEQQELADSMLKMLQADSEPASVTALPSTQQQNENRPQFSGKNADLEWYLWAQAHPEQLSDADREDIRLLEENGAFMLMVELRQGRNGQ